MSSSLRLIRNGERRLSDKMAEQIAQSCDVSVDWLLYGYEPSRRYPLDDAMARFLSGHEQVRKMIRFLMMEENAGADAEPKGEYGQMEPDEDEEWEMPSPRGDTIAERLQEVCDKKGLTIEDISEQTHTQVELVNLYINSGRDIPDLWIETFAQAYKIRPSWLRTGRGRMEKRITSSQLKRIEAAKRLKRFRQEHHLSQRETAEICEVTVGMISLVETGRSMLTLKMAENLSRRYDVSVNWFLVEDEE